MNKKLNAFGKHEKNIENSFEEYVMIMLKKEKEDLKQLQQAYENYSRIMDEEHTKFINKIKNL